MNNDKTTIEIINPEQLGQILGVSTRRINQLVNEGKLTPYQNKPKRLFKTYDVLFEYIKEQIETPLKEKINELQSELSAKRFRVWQLKEDKESQEEEIKELELKLKQEESENFALRVELKQEEELKKVEKKFHEDVADDFLKQIADLKKQIKELQTNSSEQV